ncbi:MAG: hypothetical protein ABI821_16745 [Pseudomonadota bacterium]
MAFAVAIPWLVRVAICLVLATANAFAIRRCVLLLGSGSVRALEWADRGEFTVLLGAALSAHPATLAGGSFRLGGLLVLRFRTAAGMRSVLIDGGRQPKGEFRRLCRRFRAFPEGG